MLAWPKCRLNHESDWLTVTGVCTPRIPQMGYATRLIRVGGGREVHKQPDQLALAACPGLAQNVLELLADRPRRNSSQAGNLFYREAGQEAVSDLRLSRSEAVKSMEYLVGKVQRLLGIGNNRKLIPWLEANRGSKSLRTRRR